MGCFVMTTDSFEPEFGQLVMGQPPQEFETPGYVDAALEFLAEMFFEDKNISKENPFRNTGYSWKNNVFEVHAYDWNEDHIQEYNFKYKDIKVSWYKYLGRGSSINREVTPVECWEMLKECVESLIEKYD